MSKKQKNILSIFFIEFLRIKNVIVWSGISLIGFIVGMSSLVFSNYILPLIIFLISTFFIMSFTFAINNYYDIETDKENPRRKDINALASGKISKHTGIFFILILVILPLIVTILFNLEVFFFCVFLIFLGWAYSAPPLRIKGKPGMDVIWHFVLFFSYITWGSLVAGSTSLMTWLLAISIGVWSTIGQIGNHIRDYTFDKESKTTTFTVWIGLDKSKIIIKILVIFHLILLLPLVVLYSLSYVYTILIIIGIPIVGFLILKPTKNAFPTQRSFTFFFTAVVGGAVYGSCVIHHICFLLGIPTLGLLNFTGLA